MPQTKKQAVTSVNNNKTIVGWVIGLVVGLISLIFVYGIINVSFRSVIKSGCMDGGEVNEIACDCLAGVVSAVTFVWRQSFGIHGWNSIGRNNRMWADRF